MTTLPLTLYRNAKVFTADGPATAEAMLVDGERLAFVGSEADALRLAGLAGPARVDAGAPDGEARDTGDLAAAALAPAAPAAVVDLGGALCSQASSTHTRTS